MACDAIALVPFRAPCGEKNQLMAVVKKLALSLK